MKTIAMTISCSLLAVGLVGMVRGSALADVRVEGGGASVTPTAQLLGLGGSTSTSVTTSSTATLPVPDWTPDEESIGRKLAPGETVQVIPLDVWRASLVMSDANRYELLRITACETSGTWNTALVGAAGEEGVGQVLARYWGPVPSDLRGQFAQIDRIYTEQGSWPWTTRFGCGIWSAS